MEKDLTGAERGNVLARWEREGKIECRTNLLGWEKHPDGSTGRRFKQREYLVRGHVLVTHDGRQPWPTAEQFASVALAVMAMG